MSLVDVAVPGDLEGAKAVVSKWLKKVGDAVAADEPLVELETDKVAMEVFAPAAGVLHEVLMGAGEDAGPGALLGRLSPSGSADDPAAISSTELSVERSSPTGADAAAAPHASIAQFDPGLRLSPSVRRLLMECGADPNQIDGTGRDGRLTRQDVQRHLAGGGIPSPSPPAGADARPATGGRLVPHDTMRRRIAENMARSLAEAPHVTAVFEADFSAIMAHRKAKKVEFEAQGVNLTLTAYLVVASVRAMAAAPAVNSRWRDDALEVFDHVNVGVGTALGDKGLVVPVVHQAQTLSLLGIAARLQDVTERARKGRLTPGDVRDGTFSISNHGVSGSLVAAPIIINPPQAAILGVGKVQKRVVVREVEGSDAIVIRPMAFVSLSIDHRVLDGHQTNAWLTRFIEVLETWPAA